MFINLGSPNKIIQRRAVSMPGLEKETENLDATKRNSSQANCTVDFELSVIPSNVPKSNNTSYPVITSQETNKSKQNLKK